MNLSVECSNLSANILKAETKIKKYISDSMKEQSLPIRTRKATKSKVYFIISMLSSAKPVIVFTASIAERKLKQFLVRQKQEKYRLATLLIPENN